MRRHLGDMGMNIWGSSRRRATGAQRFGIAFWIALTLGGVLASPACAAPRRILLLNSFGNSFAPFSLMASDFRAELARVSPEPIEFYEALLEAARFNDPDVEGWSIPIGICFWMVRPPSITC